MSYSLSPASLIPFLLGIVLTLFSLVADASSRLVWQNNGHSYQRFENTLTWSEAKTYCELQGGHLATITSRKKTILSSHNLEGLTLYYGSVEPTKVMKAYGLG